MTAWLSSETVLLDRTCPLPLDQPFTPVQARQYGVSRRTFQTLLAQGLVRRLTRGVYAAAQAPEHDRVPRPSPASGRVAERRRHRSGGSVAAWRRHSRGPRRASSPPSPCSRSQAHARAGVASRAANGGCARATSSSSTASPRPRTAYRVRPGRFSGAWTPWPPSTSSFSLGVSHDEPSRSRSLQGLPGRHPAAFRLRPSPIRGRSPLPSRRCGSTGTTPVCRGPAPVVGVRRLRRGTVPSRPGAPEAQFACEYDGMEFHSSDEDRAADGDRRAWLEANAAGTSRCSPRMTSTRSVPTRPRGCGEAWRQPGSGWPSRRCTRPSSTKRGNEYVRRNRCDGSLSSGVRE